MLCRSQSQTVQVQGNSGPVAKTIQGPFRVLPGRLSVNLIKKKFDSQKKNKVSRTFGDAEAKLKAYGGNPYVIIAEPDIKSFKINEEHDFIMLGCIFFFFLLYFLSKISDENFKGDGIFDRLTNKDAMKAMWETCSMHKYKNIHEFSARATENLMRDALLHKTLDNITTVMISFKNLKNALFGKKKSGSLETPNNVDKNGNLIIDSIFFFF